MATGDKVALARLLTRADEFVTFLDEHWYATLPRQEDGNVVVTSRSITIMNRFGHERKKLARGGMGAMKRMKVLMAEDVVAMIDAFKCVLHHTFFNATILVSRDLNYSYEVKVRLLLENPAQRA